MKRFDREAISQAAAGKALRVESLLAHAEQTFGSKAKADAWLRRRTSALGGRRPKDLLDCEAEAHRVEELLDRIDHGIAT